MPSPRSGPRGRSTPGEFTFGALAMAGVVVLAFGNGVATGEPALTLLAALGIATIAVGVVGSVASLRSVTVSARAPADAVAGDAVEVEVAIAGARRPLAVRILGPATQWHEACGGDHGPIAWTVPRRGVYPSLRVEVCTTWPLGLFLRRKVFVATLPVALAAAPRPIADLDERPPTATPDGSGATPRSGAGDTVRAVRPYVVGDPGRLVHWPTSARTGALVVREFERLDARGVVLRVVLPRDPGAADIVAGRAAGLGLAVLRSGDALVVASCEAGIGVIEAVGHDLQLGRRLARAGPGEPPSAVPGTTPGMSPASPLGWTVVEVHG